MSHECLEDAGVVAVGGCGGGAAAAAAAAAGQAASAAAAASSAWGMPFLAFPCTHVHEPF